MPAQRKLEEHFGGKEPLYRLGDCLVATQAVIVGEAWVEVKPDFWRDEFGVVWNRTIDKDIGNVDLPASRAVAGRLHLPDPRDPRRYAHFPEAIRHRGDRLVGCSIGFSLFERAWTLRGMENLFLDMIEAPAFVEELLDAITDYNVAVVEEAAATDRLLPVWRRLGPTARPADGPGALAALPRRAWRDGGR